jgi:hypothetical protein
LQHLQLLHWSVFWVHPTYSLFGCTPGLSHRPKEKGQKVYEGGHTVGSPLAVHQPGKFAAKHWQCEQNEQAYRPVKERMNCL